MFFVLGGYFYVVLFGICLIFTVDVHSLTANDSTKHTLLRRMKYAQVCFDRSQYFHSIRLQFSLSCALALCLSLSLSLPARETATSKQFLFTVKLNTCIVRTCQNSTTMHSIWACFRWRHLAGNSDSGLSRDNRF